MCANLAIMHQIRHTLPVTFAPSSDLYITVRGALIARGTSLNAWCKARGINRQTAEKALKGERFSRNGAAIRQALVDELFGGNDA